MCQRVMYTYGRAATRLLVLGMMLRLASARAKGAGARRGNYVVLGILSPQQSQCRTVRDIQLPRVTEENAIPPPQDVSKANLRPPFIYISTNVFVTCGIYHLSPGFLRIPFILPPHSLIPPTYRCPVLLVLVAGVEERVQQPCCTVRRDALVQA